MRIKWFLYESLKIVYDIKSFLCYDREEVQTVTESTETPEIKTKTVEDVKRAVEEAEKVSV